MRRWGSLLFLVVTGALSAHATTVSGTVKDPGGALVPRADVTVEQIQTASDASGRFQVDLAPGSCTIRVLAAGFEVWEHAVVVADKPIDIVVSLTLKTAKTTMTVSAKRSPLANSDPNYQALRHGKLTGLYRVQNLVLTRDAGIFTFRSGSFSFLPPVLGHVVTGVFIGSGYFRLKPIGDIAARHMKFLAGTDSVDEDFTALVMYFSDSTFEEIKQGSERSDESAAPHEQAYRRVRSILERRRDPAYRLALVPGDPPLTPLERLLNYEDIANYDAEVLEELYNQRMPGSFRAFMHGRKHPDLRFLVNPRGVFAGLPAPEEIALLNFDPASEADGIWYLAHFADEMKLGRASSGEDKRIVAPTHYQIDVAIGRPNLLGREPDILVTCNLNFEALENGTRMLKFDMVPDLQVSRVGWSGKDIAFVQESRDHDGSFYLQMPEPLVKGRSYQVTFEYSGGEIVQSEFGGTDPRRAWYPRPAGPASRATYDLTFHVPKGMTVVSVGQRIRQARESGFDVSEWSGNVPINLAAFRYLNQSGGSLSVYSKSATDKPTGIDLAAYLIAPPPGRPLARRSTRDLLIDTGNALHVYADWFGPSAYSGISVVASVGSMLDSLPGLICTSPYMGGFGAMVTQSIATEAMACMSVPGGCVAPPARGGPPPPSPIPSGKMRTIMDEAYAVQVSHQWWGNTVSPASFHDQWLSLGFANFSASLFDLAAHPDEFDDHWVRAKESILHPPAPAGKYCIYCSRIRPNDTGPLWLGSLNETATTRGAGYLVNSFKGGYILHMIRSLMWDQFRGDADFRAMLQDFVKQFANRAASTEDFKAVVEKHMTPAMHLNGDRRMDWFFDSWIYGIDVPSYRLEYSLTPQEGGRQLMKGTLTQSSVSAKFQMAVPVFAELGGKTIRIKVVAIRGNSSAEFRLLLPEVPKRVLFNLNHDVLTDKEKVVQLK